MKDNYIDLIPPPNFNPKIEVAGCRIKYMDKTLMLHRADHKPQGGTWGEPAGKMKNNETPIDAIIREIDEETGIHIEKSTLRFVAKFYVRYPDLDFIYHSYKYALSEKPKVKIDPSSHKDFCWVDDKGVMKLNLIGGMPTRFSKFLHLYS